MNRFATLVLLGAALAFPPTVGLALAAPGSDDGFDVTSYRLALALNPDDMTVEGREVIKLRVTADGVRQLRFSGNALSIAGATVHGVAVGSSIQDGSLAFETPAPLARGQVVELTVSYQGRPTRGLARSANAIYTSYFACDWMVCRQDHFGDKAAFSIDLTVPAGTETLSVGRLTGKRRGRDGSVIHSWRATKAYSSYLYGFAFGRFERVSEKVGAARLTYLSDIASNAELKKRFAATRDIAGFFTEKAGVPLPVAEYSQLLVKEDEAQEAATYSVIGLKSLPTTADNAAEDWAIAHELSHQWWGNLVTCETLRDFWLNEGIATFMTAAWKERRYGRAAYEAELDVARARLERARAKGFDKPLAWEGKYPTLGTRRAVQYSKGALFMDHLRTMLGETVFWSGLRRYTRRHVGGTVTSIDLQRDMEAASGRDLGSMFSEWVFGDLPAAIDAATKPS